MQKPSSASGFGDQTPFTFSASSLQDYSDCPRRFQLRYLEQLVWPSVEAEPVSETETRQRDALLFHRMVQQHLLGLPSDKLTAMAASPDLSRWWHNYLGASLDFNGYTLHTETVMAASIGDRRLVAKYDLLAIRDGKATIYDWKTHARRPRNEWLVARWQTRIYRAMLTKAGSELNNARSFEPGDISMVYWFAEFPGEPVEFQYDHPQFERDWSSIESLSQEISQSQVFPLTEDGRQCRYCVYRSLCDRGDQAGLWQDAETDTFKDTHVELDFEQIGEIEF